MSTQAPPGGPPVVTNPWASLRRFTAARIALGRAGVSLPTAAQLEFQLAHAQARDAVHTALDVAALQAQLLAAGFDALTLHSAAIDRSTYLQRPDLGRRLDEACRQALRDRLRADQHGGIDTARDGLPIRHDEAYDVAFVIADGLSALAVQQHAAPLLAHTAALLRAEGWRIAPVVIVRQGRVAVGDEIGELLQATIVAVCIGERPGLSSPDSLGVYLTHSPRVGCVDSQRNCISNVSPAGLPIAAAAAKLYYLLSESRRRKLSGVDLKDESAAPTALAGDTRSFLTDAE